PLQDHERGLRLLAAEPRVARRGLAKSLRDVFARSDAQDFYARHVTPSGDRAHGYVFLTVKRRPEFRTEERYREFRRRTVLHYCETVKLRQPDISTLIGLGLGFGAQSDDDGSIDMVMRTFERWTEEDAIRAD